MAESYWSMKVNIIVANGQDDDLPPKIYELVERFKSWGFEVSAPRLDHDLFILKKKEGNT